MPVIRHGADGELTDVVCGYLHSRDPLFDPGLRVFPPVFVVRPPTGPPPSGCAPVLDARCREVLGRSPIRYLTEWRMHIAEDLLATTDLGVGVVARRVGYDAEEAFSRAFKRTNGESPSVCVPHTCCADATTLGSLWSGARAS
jgi:hypothetical protein